MAAQTHLKLGEVSAESGTIQSLNRSFWHMTVNAQSVCVEGSFMLVSGWVCPVYGIEMQIFVGLEAAWDGSFL